MTYTINPKLPQLRMRAVLLVRKGWSLRQVARHLGYHHTTIGRWVRRAPEDGRLTIPTRSSRPHSHPQALSLKMINLIRALRLKRGRCAEVVHRELLLMGIKVSLSSVKRTLKRQGLIKSRSPWKRWHFSSPRPLASLPGELVEIDTIHLVEGKQKQYIYTLLDVNSRWAFALPSARANTRASLEFVRRAERLAGFKFKTIQSDHGSEFSQWFSEQVASTGLTHRHSRVRQPNDNGHLERFNRTIQEECINLLDYPLTLSKLQRALDEYLPYYNEERLHLGLNLKTPMQMVQRY